MMRFKPGLIFVVAILLGGCDTHVHDPWVQDEAYLEEERSRSQALNEQLDDRVRMMVDR